MITECIIYSVWLEILRIFNELVNNFKLKRINKTKKLRLKIFDIFIKGVDSIYGNKSNIIGM